MTRGADVAAARVHGWFRLAVAGATEAECLERVRKVVSSYRGRRVSIEHPRGQYGLLLPHDPAHPPLILQRVPEPKTAKARIHFDIRVHDVEAKAIELERLGATRIDVGQPADASFIPMADPEGNEFCVCPGVPLRLDAL